MLSDQSYEVCRTCASIHDGCPVHSSLRRVPEESKNISQALGFELIQDFDQFRFCETRAGQMNKSLCAHVRLDILAYFDG